VSFVNDTRLTKVEHSTQEAYEKNVKTLFKSLDRAEEHLATTPGPYYYGENITEADVRLYTTIVRFDVSLSTDRSTSSHYVFI